MRFHLWVSLGVAALAALGVERLGRPGVVSLRGGLVLAGMLVALSIPIMIYIYVPVWTQPKRWTGPEHIAKFRWLGRELMFGVIRTAVVAMLAWWVARMAARTGKPVTRDGWPRFSRSWSWLIFWVPTSRRAHGRSALLDRTTRSRPVSEVRPPSDPRLWQGRLSLPVSRVTHPSGLISSLSATRSTGAFPSSGTSPRRGGRHR